VLRLDPGDAPAHDELVDVVFTGRDLRPVNGSSPKRAKSSSNPQVSDVGAARYSTPFVGYDTGQQTPHLLHVHERRRPWLRNLRFSIYTVLAEEETPAVKLLTTCTLAGSS
jgi:hypothetical protein